MPIFGTIDHGGSGDGVGVGEQAELCIGSGWGKPKGVLSLPLRGTTVVLAGACCAERAQNTTARVKLATQPRSFFI